MRATRVHVDTGQWVDVGKRGRWLVRGPVAEGVSSEEGCENVLAATSGLAEGPDVEDVFDVVPENAVGKYGFTVLSGDSGAEDVLGAGRSACCVVQVACPTPEISEDAVAEEFLNNGNEEE